MARIAKLRDSRSLQRRSGHKPPRSITLIVCEGETERAYLDAARSHYGLNTAEVILAENTEGSAPISVVAFAEEKCGERGGYDHVFCVFDHDDHESFDRARARVKVLATRKRDPLPMRSIVSIPCFEIWILLHLERTDAPFNACDEVLAKVRARVPAYRKGDTTVVRQLVGTALEKAIENAAWLAERAPANDYRPYTEIHLLLNHFAAVRAVAPS